MSFSGSPGASSIARKAVDGYDDLACLKSAPVSQSLAGLHTECASHPGLLVSRMQRVYTYPAVEVLLGR